MKAVLTGPLILALTACAVVQPPPSRSAQDLIQRELRAAAPPAALASSAPLPPGRVIEALLPPPTLGLSRVLEQQIQPRFDLLLTDAPVEQVFATLVADTRYSVMLSQRAPGASGTERMTVHLKHVTLEEALDAIRETHGFEYRIDGTRIHVQRAALTSRLFRVNYVLGQRRGVSDVQVISGASVAGGAAGGGSGSGSGSGFASTQASALSSSFKADIWGETEDSLRTLLGCTVGKATTGTGTTGAAGAAAGAAASGTAGRGGGSRADVSFPGDVVVAERQRGGEGCPGGRALSVNAASGTILVRAMPDELRSVEALLKSLQMAIERQVVIEAKVVDVTLNSAAQQGINWAAFRGGQHRFSVGASTGDILNAGRGTSATGPTLSGELASGSTLGSLLGIGMSSSSGSAFATGLGVAMQFSNFSALLNFLETQGRVHVLSSPRIATLNNQKAVLKVGAEEPFVTNVTAGTTNINNNATVSTPPTLSYQPFFSGISLDVTPQISEGGEVVLHVHSMVNTVTEKLKISAPSTSAVAVPFAVNSISETDSVVRARNGQMVVIGGLMTERTHDQRSRVPGAGEVPGAGALFSQGEQQATKRELVILLRATVVEDDGPWRDAIQSSARRLDSEAPPLLSLPAARSAP